MSGMLGGGGGGVSAERYAGMQVSTAMQGQVIPYITGRTRVPMNLIWYGNFQSSGSGSAGKGGGAPSSWTYSAGWIAALGLGPITGIFTVWHDKSIVTLTYENLGYALGTTGQAVWTGYPSGTPAAQKIPYSGIAYVATNLYQFGSSPSMPNLTFEVEGIVPGYSDAHAMYDSDLSAVIPDYLQNPVHGAGFQGTIATLTGTTNTFQAYCQALGLLVSLNEDTQRAATDCMKENMQIANSDFVLSCGTLKVIPYADAAVSATTADGTTWSYTPNLTPIYSFTDADYCPKKGDEPVKLVRKAIKDTYNIINIEVLDRTNYYNPAPVTASDNWDISNNGPRVMATITLHQICSVSVGKMVAQLILQQQLYDRNTWEFRVRADYCLLEPMDLVSLTDAAVGLNQKLCRIAKIEDDGDDYITITAIEVTGTTRNAPQYNWAANAGYAANYDAAPGSISTPALFQMPAIPGAYSGGITIGIGVCGPTSAAFWGGCNVYCSADAGATYEQVGSIGANGPARYGLTTSAIGAVPDADTTSTLGVALVNTTLQLSTAVTHADADAAQTLLLVDTLGAAEVMSYGTAALVSAGTYNLTYLRRNQYGSTNQAHASGVPFVRLDGAIFQLPIDPGAAGQTLYFKFCSFNSVGRNVQPLSAATAYSYLVPSVNSVGGAVSLVPRGAAAITLQGTAYKNGGTGAWDSDCVSVNAYQSVSVSAQYTNGGALSVGLATNIASVNPPTGGYYYGIYFHADSGTTQAFAAGTALWTGSAPAKNDLGQVTYDGFTFRYYYNGVLVASYQQQGLSLYIDLAFFSGTLSNVETTVGALATPTQFVATGTAVISDSHAGKPTGANAWDSSIYSILGYPTAHISGKPTNLGTAGEWMLGLTGTPTLSPSYTNMAVGWFQTGVSGGFWQIYQNGTVVGSYPTVALTDVVAVTYDGSNFRCYLNGVLEYTVATAGATVYGFASFFFPDPAGGINSLSFGPTTNLAVVDTSQVGANAATVIALATASNVTCSSSNVGTNTTIASVTVGPFPYATEVILTSTGQWSIPSSGGGAAVNYGYTTTAGAYTGGFSPIQITPVTASEVGGLAIEASTSLAANTTTTYYLYGISQPGTGPNNFLVNQATIKAEVIKR